MVRYYGRQKLLTSALNATQIGLKMSGGSSSVGHSISTRRYTNRRVRNNLKFCGPVYYHGQLWSDNSGDICVKRAPKNQSLSGGVGRINNPRTKCNINCMSYKDSNLNENTTFTFNPKNISVQYSVNGVNQLTNLFGNLSTGLLNILNSKGFLTETDANTPEPGNWYIANNLSPSSSTASTFIRLVYTVKNSKELSTIYTNLPTLNGIKGTFVQTTSSSGNSLLFTFENIIFESGNTYTLSFN
jgi:hypothetical protein